MLGHICATSQKNPNKIVGATERTLGIMDMINHAPTNFVVGL